MTSELDVQEASVSIAEPILGLMRKPWKSSASGGSFSEYAIDLRLRHGEVGCRWQTADGSLPPEATIASSSDSVKMHPDEFLEAFAHTGLGKWGAEWLGFRVDPRLLSSLQRDANIPGIADPTAAASTDTLVDPSMDTTAIGPRIVQSPLHALAKQDEAADALPSSAVLPPSAPATPMLLKHLAFERLHTAYQKPVTLCLRITGGADLQHDLQEDTSVKSTRTRARVDVLNCGAVRQEVLALQDTLCAQQGAAQKQSNSLPRTPLEHALAEIEHMSSGDALDGDGRTFNEAVRTALNRVAPCRRESVLTAFCTQIAQMIDDFSEGSYFQFATASLWCICEDGNAIADVGIASGQHIPPPAVRLSHFADMSMHRNAGSNPKFMHALNAIHKALRSIKLESGRRDDINTGPHQYLHPEEGLHEMND